MKIQKVSQSSHVRKFKILRFLRKTDQKKSFFFLIFSRHFKDCEKKKKKEPNERTPTKTRRKAMTKKTKEPSIVSIASAM